MVATAAGEKVCRQQVLSFHRRIEAKAVALVGESSRPRRVVAPVGAHASHVDLEETTADGHSWHTSIFQNA